jgi:hypothetical protein
MRALADPSPLREVAFLVDAAAGALPGPERGAAGRARRRSFDESMEWASDLYARLLEHDQRAMR